MSSGPAYEAPADLEKAIRDDDRKVTDAQWKDENRPKLNGKDTNDRFVSASDLRPVNRAISSRSRGPTTPKLEDDQLRRLGRALSSQNARSRLSRTKSAKAAEAGEEDDGIDVEGVLGRIFHRDNATKRLGVAFKNLVVDGEGFGVTEGENMGAIASNFWPPNIVKNIKTKKRTPVRRLVNDFSGVVEPGGAFPPPSICPH